MKQLTCEMCGSTDIVKQDGTFVCQSCGCKYSVEEAKKLMIEGTVDVSGSTVKIDQSNEVKNLLELARRAKVENDSEKVQIYYEEILLKDPSCWEAVFYPAWYRVKEGYPFDKLDNCIETVICLIKNNTTDSSERLTALQELSSEMLRWLSTTFDTSYSKGSSAFNAGSRLCSFSYCVPIMNFLLKFGNVVVDCFGDEYALDIAVPFWKEGVRCYNTLLSKLTDQDSHRKKISTYVAKIQKYDPSYLVPEAKGCYVATCVYGSYDCPEVWTLRRYRDNTLAGTWCGRAFIRTYYAVSPTLVKWFGHTAWFKKMWKGKLDRMVEKLQSEGVESTPYQDKQW